MRPYGFGSAALAMTTKSATDQPDGQITQNLSSPAHKNISLAPSGKSVILTWRVSPERGACARHERAVRCGGRKACARRARVKRTAKSCGPDAAVLASSRREAKFLRDDGGKRAVHRGEHEVSRKATAQGRPGCLRLNLYARVRFFVRICTRDRGCSVHPVFPAPSVFGGTRNFSKPRAQCAARTRVIIESRRFLSHVIPAERSATYVDPYTAADIVLPVWSTALFQQFRR